MTYDDILPTISKHNREIIELCKALSDHRSSLAPQEKERMEDEMRQEMEKADDLLRRLPVD